jgi:ribosomal protein S18 acetylase RimI-like enzyme
MLAHLMIEAYRGTTDDHGETMEDARQEVRRLLDGEYGQLLPNFSEVIERNGQLVAATLLTLWQDAPLVAFSITRPAWKRTGLARAGLKRSINRLFQNGYDELCLVVTRGNDAAERLYESVGFRDLEEYPIRGGQTETQDQ